MYSHVLVVIDFSDPSVEALCWVARRFPDCEVTLFHAIERIRPPTYLLQELGEEIDLRLEKELDVRANLELLAQECGIEARIEIRTGWAPREVNQAAVEADVDLIVVAAPRRQPWSRLGPGSTLNRLFEQPERPLYVWRPIPRQAHPHDRTVLAALDLRAGSEPVAAAAAEVAEHFGARLVLVHVLTRTLQAYLRAVSSPQMGQDTLNRLARIARDEALSQVAPEVMERLDVQARVVRGRPVTQILATAEEESANLIVLGGSGAQSLSGRTFMGGVTDRVLRTSSSSILSVPI